MAHGPSFLGFFLYPVHSPPATVHPVGKRNYAEAPLGTGGSWPLAHGLFSPRSLLHPVHCPLATVLPTVSNPQNGPNECLGPHDGGYEFCHSRSHLGMFWAVLGASGRSPKMANLGPKNAKNDFPHNVLGPFGKVNGPVLTVQRI